MLIGYARVSTVEPNLALAAADPEFATARTSV
jgi:hypothetical protein